MAHIESEMASRSIDSSKIDLKIDEIKDITTTETVSLDNVIRKCGDFGRFQIFHYIFLNFISICAGVVAFYYIFGAADPNHRCRLPSDIWPNDTEYKPMNSTYEILINTYIPKEDNGKWKKCVMYETGNLNDTLIKCPNGWVYDRSIFGYTFTEEANLVCNSKTKKSWIATMVQTGGFFLLFIGSFGDKFGRKMTAILTILILIIICLITQILMQWVPMSINVKFGLLLLNQLSSGLALATYSVIFILIMELTSVSHTALAGNIALIAFTIGEGMVSLFAYISRDWQILKWANTIFISLILFYLYFMPETPMFLYSKREYSRLETLLRRMATMNGRHESEWYPYYQKLLQSHKSALTDSFKLSMFEKFYQLISHRRTLIKLLICALIGFTTRMLFIKISYGLAGMAISPYLNILIGVIVEAFGYITGYLLISTRLGRKISFIIVIGVTAACVLTVPFVVKKNSTITIIIAQFSKFAISGSIVISWIYVPELFKTSIRSSVNGIFIAASRIGAIVAPIIDTIVPDEHIQHTFYASSALAIIILILTFRLPETKDKPLDKIQDNSISGTFA